MKKLAVSPVSVSGFCREVESSATDGSAVWRVRIIQAGEGSSGYHLPEAIERDFRTAFPVGTKSFLNHIGSEESWNRPERSVTDICGKLVSEPEYDPTDQCSYANVWFSPAHAPLIEAFKDVLGMSIYAYCETEIGTIGEYTGTVITKYVPSPFNTVDVVTVAGANGAILEKLSESLTELGPKGATLIREVADSTPNTESTEMDIKEIQALIEASNKALVKELTETLAPVAPAAEPVVESDLVAGLEAVAESGLPKEVRAVAYEAVKSGTPAATVIASQTALVESIKQSLVEAENAKAVDEGRALSESATYESIMPKGW